MLCHETWVSVSFEETSSSNGTNLNFVTTFSKNYCYVGLLDMHIFCSIALVLVELNTNGILFLVYTDILKKDYIESPRSKDY